jgi:hypothetical protein
VTFAAVALAFAAAVSLATVRAPAADPAPDVVPFTFVDGHIFVDAQVDGHGPYRFAVDTGAGNAVATDVADALGLKTGPPFDVDGTGEHTVRARATHIALLRLGATDLTDQPAIVIPFDELRNVEGVPGFAGLIGHQLFERYVVRIDYAGETLSLIQPAAYAPSGGVVVPFTLAGDTPLVEGDVDGMKGRFTIDTGDRGALSLTAPFVKAHALIERYAPRTEGVSGWGIGGPVRAYIVRPKQLRIGSIVITGPVTRLTEARHGFFTSDSIAGNIGNGILERYVVTFDFTRRRMVLEPNPGVAESFVYDRSGTWLVQNGPLDTVFDVVAGGPADAAGLVAGDAIERIDGRAVDELTLGAVREILRGPPGTRVVLRVKRGSTERDLTIVLRDLV